MTLEELYSQLLGFAFGIVLGYVVGRLHAFTHRLELLERVKTKLPKRRKKDEDGLKEA